MMGKGQTLDVRAHQGGTWTGSLSTPLSDWPQCIGYNSAHCVLVSLCCVTNDHRLSGWNQHTLIIL